MKRIKILFLMLIAVITTITLVSCGDSNKAKVTVSNVTAMRTSVGVTLSVNDEDEVITENSIKATIYDLDDDKAEIAEKSFDEKDTAEQTKIFENLDALTNYRVIVTATINKKKITYDKVDVKTTNVGATADSPVVITSKAEFLNINKDVEAYYKLDADLDFADGETKTVVDKLFDKTTQFLGHFDGNNHKITNVKLSTVTEYQGLFGYIGVGASVSNLTIENVELDVTKSSNFFCGIIAGVNFGTISNVQVKNATIKTSGTSTSSHYIGGLVGENNNVIDKCSIDTLSIDSSSRKQLTIGGLVGANGGNVNTALYGCKINESYLKNATIKTLFNSSSSASDVEFFAYVGGIAGSSKGDIIDSYADADISLLSYKNALATPKNDMYVSALGGIVGTAINGGTITDVAFLGKIDYQSKDIYKAYIGGIAGKLVDGTINNAVAIITSYGLFTNSLATSLETFAKNISYETNYLGVDPTMTNIAVIKSFDYLEDVYLQASNVTAENVTDFYTLDNETYTKVADATTYSSSTTYYAKVTSKTYADTVNTAFDYSNFKALVKAFIDTNK